METKHIAPAAMFLGSDLCADRTGHVLAAAGQQMYIFKVVQSTGKFKDGLGAWNHDYLLEVLGAGMVDV